MGVGSETQFLHPLSATAIRYTFFICSALGRCYCYCLGGCYMLLGTRKELATEVPLVLSPVPYDLHIDTEERQPTQAAHGVTPLLLLA